MVPWRADWPRYLALSIGVAIGAFGAVVLACWYAHFVTLIQPWPNMPPLTRQGGLSQMLCGTSLAFLALGRKRAATVCAAIVLVLTVLVILEYSLDRNLGIDALLGNDYITNGSQPAGRMSPVASCSYLGASLALLAMSSRRLGRFGPAVAGSIASALIAFGSVTFFSYSLGHNMIYAWGHFRNISIQAASVLVLLGVGIMAEAWRESRSRLPGWLPLGIGLGLTVGAMGVWQALIAQKEGQLMLLSHIILAGGIFGSLLVAIALQMTLKATQRSHELQEGKARFEGLFEASPDALLVSDHHGRIVGANLRVTSIFGYTPKELLGASIESLIPVTLHDLHSMRRERYYSHPTLRPMGAGLELLGRRKDGSEFPVEVALSPLQSGGEKQVLAAVRDITERKQGQEALQQSEERFRGVFDASPLGLALISQDYRLVRVNRSLSRLSGYSEAELLTLNPLDFTHPDDREESARLAESLFKGEIPYYQIDKRYVKKNGEIMWVTMTATILRDREGRPTYGLGMIADITERKQEQEALRQSEERFRGIFEQGPLGVTLIGKDQRLVKVNQAFCQMMGYSEEELTRMTPLDITYPDDRVGTLERVERLVDFGAPVQNVEKRYVTKSGEIIWGSLNTSVIHDREGRLLYGMGLVEDITERKQAQDQLRQSEERFREIFEQGPIGIVLMGKDYRLTKPNAAFCNMLGYSAEELTGMSMLDITYPDDRKPSVDMVENIFSTAAPHLKLEKRYVKKSGEIMWGSVTTAAIHDDRGRPLYSVGMIEDITELKRAQETLRESEERFRGIFEQGPIGVALLGLDHRIAKANPAFCRMLGYSEAELAKMTPLDMTHPDDRNACGRLLARLDNGEIPVVTLEKRYVKKSGEIMWVSLTASVIRDREGRPLCGLGMIEDVTERKRADDELRALTQRLSLATRSSSMGVWDWNVRTDRAIWDDTMCEIFDIPKKASVRREDWVRRIHPDDVEKIDAFLDKVIREKTQDSMEYRILRSDGFIRHLFVAGGAVLDDHGDVTGVVGIAVDITERKRTEEELHTLSERLSLATQFASIGVWDWDLRTNLEVWDDAVFEMYDRPKVNPVPHEYSIGRIHPDDLSKVSEAIERVIQGKAQASVEFRIIRWDGSVRHLSLAAGPVLDEQGKVVRMVGIAIDVTGRKQMEEKIEASRQQMIASARLSALGMMAGGIAHEINNPLSIIHAMASDLQEMVTEAGSVAPQVVARKSGIIRDTSERIAKIVKSLRQISREGAADPPHPTPLAKILDETLEICRARFTANRVTLLLPSSIPPITVPCREVQIAQALLNLLQNAFDAVVEKEGERWVKIEVRTCEDSVAISVIDNGHGIPPEVRSRIMEPFFTTKEVGKGTGLGLSLSKTIAEEHGGKLEFGEDNGHTRFSLVLPLAAQAEAA